jgi:hypothetical protein
MRRLGRSSRAVLAGMSFAAFAGAFVTTPVVVRGAAPPAAGTAPLVSPIPAPTAVAVVLPRRDPFAGDAPRMVVTTTPASAAATALASAATATPPFPAIPGSTSSGSAIPFSVFPGRAVAGVSVPAVLGPLPPNAGAPRAASPFGAPPPFGAPSPFAAPPVRVTAVVTGAHPFALVDEPGTTRLVTVGDRVAGQTIAAITADGIRLANGAVLTVAPGSSPVLPDHGGRQP